MGYNFNLPPLRQMSERELALFLRSHIDFLQFAMNDMEDKHTALESKHTALEEKIADTGWIDLGLSSDVGATTNNDVGRNGAGCYYRVLNGNHVYIAFNCYCDFNGAPVQINANTLPDNILPKYNATSLANSEKRKVARCTAFKDGNILVEWARNHDNLSETNVTLPWLDGFIEYFI